MKKFLIIISAGFICLLSSCNSKKEESGMSDKAKKNLEANAAITKMFETGDWSKVGDYIAADGIDHTGMTGEVKGLDSLKAEFVMMGNMMSDMKNEVVKELADDDYVMSWMKESWTMKADGMGMKAGDKMNVNAIDVSKFKDGKSTDHWGFISMTDMMKMMPPPPPAKDTTMHK